MAQILRRLKVFVGFQIESDFHTTEQLHQLLALLSDRLRETQAIELEVKFGILPPGVIMWDELRKAIRESHLAIFDISENNANVMIEVGLAYGFGKQVFLLKNRSSEATYKKPADIASVYVPYDGGGVGSGTTCSDDHQGPVPEASSHLFHSLV